MEKKPRPVVNNGDLQNVVQGASQHRLSERIHAAACGVDFLHMNTEAINLINSSSPLCRKASWCYFWTFGGGIPSAYVI